MPFDRLKKMVIVDRIRINKNAKFKAMPNGIMITLLLISRKILDLIGFLLNKNDIYIYIYNLQFKFKIIYKYIIII